jgi:hypothetical protein
MCQRMDCTWWISCIQYRFGEFRPLEWSDPKTSALGSFLWTLHIGSMTFSIGCRRPTHCVYVSIVAASGYSNVLRIVEFTLYHASSGVRRQVRTPSHHSQTFWVRSFTLSVIFPSGCIMMSRAFFASYTSSRLFRVLPCCRYIWNDWCHVFAKPHFPLSRITSTRYQ